MKKEQENQLHNMSNSDIILCKMQSKHVDAVYEISKKSLKEAWDKNSINAELNNPLASYLVAIKNDVVLGFVGIWIIAGEGNITNVAVDPTFRGLGIGKLLMQSILENCINENVDSITLEVRKSNLIAQNLYESLGFKNEGVRKKFYPDKEDAIIMWYRRCNL
ncbi:ribosomal protein S18-alanine N-acetyltransferase [Clostridium collagenovorans]